jgi:hypothetical protein
VFQGLGGGGVGGLAAHVDVLGGGDLGLAQWSAIWRAVWSASSRAVAVLRRAWDLIQASLSDSAGCVASSTWASSAGDWSRVIFVRLDELCDELVVDFDAAGLDEFDFRFGPGKEFGDLFARHAGGAAEGSEGEA